SVALGWWARRAVRDPGERVELVGRRAFPVGVEQLAGIDLARANRVGRLGGRELAQLSGHAARARPSLATRARLMTAARLIRLRPGWEPQTLRGPARGRWRAPPRAAGMARVGPVVVARARRPRARWAAPPQGRVRGSSRCARVRERARAASARARRRSAQAGRAAHRAKPVRDLSARAGTFGEAGGG